MKPYLWMTDFTPQREWIDGKGLLLWMAFFFSEVGAGLYLVSLLLGFWTGCLTGWISCALLGGGLHIAYLGKPMRVWRSVLRPGSSELSRGIILMGAFVILGAFQLAPGVDLLSGLPWKGDSLFFKIVLGVLAFFVIIHGFITLSFMGAVPFWNSAIMPALSLTSGIWVGTQVSMGLALVLGKTQLLVTVEPVARWFFLSYVLLVLFYLWAAGHGPLASQKSLALMIKGDLAPLFYLGVLPVALIIPATATLYFYSKPVEMAVGLLWIRIFCAVLGDVALRYCIFKAARYMPLINSNIVTGPQFP